MASLPIPTKWLKVCVDEVNERMWIETSNNLSKTDRLGFAQYAEIEARLQTIEAITQANKEVIDGTASKASKRGRKSTKSGK